MLAMISKTSYHMKKQINSVPTMLASWGPRAIYVGPGFQLPAHRNTVAVLALAMETPMRAAIDASDLTQGFRVCNSVLIEPNQLHLIDTGTHDCVFIYLDALSDDLAILRGHCIYPGKKLSFNLRNEREVIDLLVRMPRNAQSWRNTEASLARVLGFIQGQNDQRITTVVNALLLSPNDTRRAEEWASHIGLSSSRFQHLFKESVGLSFRRFRLWARMRIALKYALRGSSLTEAAMVAGLSSSAHLSAAFKDMFGITPSQLISASPTYIET
jgi:AraC-like DNA-binding protein